MKRTAKIIFSFLLAFSLLPIRAEAAEGNWGLGYGKEGTKPTGNATAEELKKNNSYYVGTGDDKVIYLTFDAGFENGNTDKILDTLKEEKVPAAFFLVGTYIRDNPELVKRMVKEKHIVGNHTMNHPDMSAIANKEEFAKALTGAEKIYKKVIGKKMPKYYRPPEGKYSKANLQMAKQLGYTTVFWSLAYVDWEVNNQPTKEQAFSKLIPRVHPGTVLLLHSTSETNANILKDLIREYKKMGYEFRSLDDLA